MKRLLVAPLFLLLNHQTALAKNESNLIDLICIAERTGTEDRITINIKEKTAKERYFSELSRVWETTGNYKEGEVKKSPDGTITTDFVKIGEQEIKFGSSMRGWLNKYNNDSIYTLNRYTGRLHKWSITFREGKLFRESESERTCTKIERKF